MEQVRWAKENLKTLDRMTRKVLTINGAFYSKSDVDRLYVTREDGGLGLMSCEGCVRGEENSLEWYVRNSLDVLLQGIRVTAEIESGETVRKKNEDIWSNELTLHSCKEKKLQGQFLRGIPETTHGTGPGYQKHT